MSKILRSILALSFIITMISCEKSSPEPITVIDVQQDFDVIPVQKLGDNGAFYQLIIRSKSLSSCENDELDASMSQLGDLITIQINGNLNPVNCIEGSIFTEKTFTLPVEEGLYNIEFKQGELTSTSGLLEISDERFNLDIEEVGGIFIEQSTLLNIPEDLVWGYIYLDESINSSALPLEEIDQELKFVIESYPNLNPGDYSLFVVDADQMLIIENAPKEAVMQSLLVSNNLEWENLKRNIIRLEEDYPGLKYRFTRFDGLEIWN